MPGRVVVVTGAMAAGKSTVAALLADRLPRSVHVRGDLFRRMVVNGRVDMTPDADPEALQQLQLRYALAAHTADTYAAAGFDAVVQDVVLGPALQTFVDLVRTRPRHLVVLCPRPDELARREAGRAKTGYGRYTPADLDAALRTQTPRLGYWLDSTSQTPGETVEDILANLDRAAV